MLKKIMRAWQRFVQTKRGEYKSEQIKADLRKKALSWIEEYRGI